MQVFTTLLALTLSIVGFSIIGHTIFRKDPDYMKQIGLRIGGAGFIFTGISFSFVPQSPQWWIGVAAFTLVIIIGMFMVVIAEDSTP